MLLVLIAVGMATVLSMTFLASQATTHGVAQNIQSHAQARSVAESALVVAINYVQTDADVRTDKSHGQWVNGASFNGGTFDLYGYDGIDTDSDGVVDDTDSDLADDSSDPVTLTVIGYFDGVSHTVHAVVTPSTATGLDILMVVANDASLTTQDDAKKALLESWGYTVILISDHDSQADFSLAFSQVDVAYLTNEASASTVNSKLANASIGVVYGLGSMSSYFNIGTNDGYTWNNQIDITDNSHYITSTFSTGALTIGTSSIHQHYISSTNPAGVDTLAERMSSSNDTLMAVDVGGALNGGGTAPSRRVKLPWGDSGFDINALNSDGETILKRSLEWAGASSVSGTVYDYATRTQGTNIWAYDGQSSSKVPSGSSSPGSQLSIGEYDDLELDDSSTHSYSVSSNNRYAQNRYVFQIDEAEAGVSQLVVSWVGRNANNHSWQTDGVELHIWNYGTGSYEQLDVSASTSAEVSLAGAVTSDLADYLGGSGDDTVTLLAVSRDYRRSGQSNVLYSDYVSLSVTTSSGGAASAGSPQLVALYEFQEVTVTPTVVGQWKLDDTAAAGSTYDFASRTQGTKVWAYDGQSSTAPPNSNSSPSSQFNGGEYDDIENDDSDSHSYSASSNYRYPMMRYVFVIDETEASVNQINVTWIGSNSNQHSWRTDGVELYIWNYSSGSYELLDVSADTTSEVTLSGAISANLADYIGGGSDDTITILAQSRDYRRSGQTNRLYNDHISLGINDGLTAVDSTGSNDGTPGSGVTGGSTGMGDGGTGFSFDGGSNGVITIPADPTLNFPDDFSLSGWFKLDNNFNSSTSTTQILVAKHINNDYNMILALTGQDYNRWSVPSGRMVFKIEGGSSSVGFMHYVWTAKSSWTAGQWYHFTAVLDSNYAPNNMIYIDGVDDSAGTENGGGSDALNLAFNSDITIGGGSADSGQLSGDRFFKGTIDEVRLLGQVLTDSQIAELAAITEPTADTVPIAYDTSGFGVPLNLDIQIPTNVTWIPGGGLEIDTATRLISTSQATMIYDALTATNQMSVEVIFTPANTSQSGPARIVSYSGGTSDSNFTFGQSASAFVTRLNTTTTTSNGTPEADSGSALTTGQQEHVIMSYDGANITLYRDGGSSVTLARTGDFDWNNAFDLILGNEAVDGYDWLGTLSRVAIYDMGFSQNQANNVFGGSAPGDGTAGGVGGIDWIEP